MIYIYQYIGKNADMFTYCKVEYEHKTLCGALSLEHLIPAPRTYEYHVTKGEDDWSEYTLLCEYENPMTYEEFVQAFPELFI